MSITNLITKIDELFGDRVNYLPYSISEIEVIIGMAPVKGLQYVSARYNSPQNRLVMGLSGSGVLVPNINKSGIIEVGILNGAASIAAIQVLELTGIAYPVAATDLTTSFTSTIFAGACRRVGTPEWRRAAAPGIDILTFATANLIISDGLRAAE